MVFDRLRAELELDTSGFRSGIRTARGGMDDLASKAKNTGRRMQSAGRRMTMGVTAPLLAAGGAAAKFAADFDKEMTESIAIMGDVSDAMREDMAKTARDVAAETTVSASEAAESYFYLASAGLDAAESQAALGDVARFAQAGMFDMATATDLLTDATSALGKETDEMVELGDQLVKANTLANASVQQFSEALTNRAAARMRDANVATEEGIAVLAAFADQGVKGRRAGRRLNIMLRDLQNAASENADAFQDLGISVYDSEGNLRNVADIVEDMEGALGDMDAEARTAAMSQLGLTRQSEDAVASLLGQSDAIREYESELADAGGTTEDVADKQMESASVQLGIFRDNVVMAAAAFGKVLLPPLVRLSERLTPLMEKFRNLSTRQQQMIAVTAAVVAAIGPLLLVLGTLVTMAPAIYAGLSTIGTGFTMLLGPVGLLIAAIGLLVAAFATDFMGIRTITENTVSGIMTRIQPLIDLLADDFIKTLNVWRDGIASILSYVESVWAEHGEAVMSVMNPLFENLEIVMAGFFDYFITIVRAILAVLRGDFSGAFEILLNFWERQGERFEEIGENAIKALVNGIKAIAPEVGETAEEIAQDIRDKFPGSDAKEGPLSDWEDSTRNIPITVMESIADEQSAVASEAEDMAGEAAEAARAELDEGLAMDVGELEEGLPEGTDITDVEIASNETVDAPDVGDYETEAGVTGRSRQTRAEQTSAIVAAINQALAELGIVVTVESDEAGIIETVDARIDRQRQIAENRR